jgi:hypothetical protein
MVRLLKNERNLGWHAASARALAEASGNWIYSGSADDYVLPGFFQAVCELLDRHPEIGVGCAKVVTITPDGERIRSDGFRLVPQAACLSPAEFRRLCLAPEPPTHSLSSATIYRRDWLQKVGGWRMELGSWSDTFAIHAIALQTGLCYAPHEGTAWRLMPGSMSHATAREPLRHLQIIRRAAALMRSPEFAAVFPSDYIASWESRSIDVLARLQFQPAIEGYQALQATSRSIAERSSWPTRCLLEVLRLCMKACYAASHRLQLTVARRELLRQERQKNQDC